MPFARVEIRLRQTAIGSESAKGYTVSECRVEPGRLLFLLKKVFDTNVGSNFFENPVQRASIASSQSR